MEYKICENCNSKIHVRTVKCPECNTILTEASKIINDENSTENIQKDIGENVDIQITETETINNHEKTNSIPEQLPHVIVPEEKKDYVYKAEVRHSVEFTKPLSNTLKVFLTALSTTPLMGQLIGTFFGIFFLSYDDTDRKTFGKALILLSVITFIFYFYSLAIYSQMLDTGFTNYLNNFVK